MPLLKMNELGQVETIGFDGEMGFSLQEITGIKLPMAVKTPFTAKIEIPKLVDADVEYSTSVFIKGATGLSSVSIKIRATGGVTLTNGFSKIISPYNKGEEIEIPFKYKISKGSHGMILADINYNTGLKSSAGVYRTAGSSQGVDVKEKSSTLKFSSTAGNVNYLPFADSIISTTIPAVSVIAPIVLPPAPVVVEQPVSAPVSIPAAVPIATPVATPTAAVVVAPSGTPIPAAAVTPAVVAAPAATPAVFSFKHPMAVHGLA